MKGGMDSMTYWSLCTPTFSGKSYKMYVIPVKMLREVICDSILCQRLFPLQEPGMNYQASPLTMEEIKVNLAKCPKKC